MLSTPSGYARDDIGKIHLDTCPEAQGAGPVTLEELGGHTIGRAHRCARSSYHEARWAIQGVPSAEAAVAELEAAATDQNWPKAEEVSARLPGDFTTHLRLIDGVPDAVRSHVRAALAEIMPAAATVRAELATQQGVDTSTIVGWSVSDQGLPHPLTAYVTPHTAAENNLVVTVAALHPGLASR